jgi:hypothetical protein
MSLTTTATAICAKAFYTLGVYSPGESIQARDLNTAFGVLQELVDAMNTQALTVLVVERTVYDLAANQGTPANPYTIGPGGDFDTGTAARPMSIQGASLLLNSTAPYPTEIPLAILNTLPQTLYYNPTNPLGTITLWNVPNTSENDLVLYTDRLTPNFSALSAAYVCPPGYAKMFRLCLADALTLLYAIEPSAAEKIRMDASDAMKDIKLANVKMTDLAVDPAFAPDPRGTYNIFTDQGG